MIKIVDENIVDIVPCTGGILFARKQQVADGRWKISFHALDMKKMKIAPVMRGSYLRTKFGDGFRHIAKSVGDYISCEAATFDNEHTVILFPTGQIGLFDTTGKSVWSNELLYHDVPVQSVVVDGQKLWCAVPQENSIVSYSIQHKKFYMRIGSKASTALANPQSVVKYGNELFVSCADAKKIRAVQLNNYAVRDFRTFDEPVYRYLRVCSKEIVWLASGVYIL